MKMIVQLPHDKLVAPAWLDELCPAPSCSDASTGTAVHFAEQGDTLRIHAKLHDADTMDAKPLEDAVAEFYSELFGLMHKRGRPYPLRIWNGLPGIVERMSAPAAEIKEWESIAPKHEPFDRYMAFNTGRNTAFRKRFGDDDGLAQFTPAATAVGHHGEDLQIHILASTTPGQAIENPRQTPAYNYSPRYGPSPPVFVRATRFGDRLFVSGTASIVGENSMHPDELHKQFSETIANINAIIQHAEHDDLALRHFRIYAPCPDDLPVLSDALSKAYPSLQSLELMRADICRRNLRVEIEAAT